MIKDAVLDAMVAAGCTAEQIAAAIKADRSGASNADRQRRYRERKKGVIVTAVAQQDVTLRNGDVSDPASPLKESSPTPPKENNPSTSSEPTGSSEDPRWKRPGEHATEFRAVLANADPDLVEAYVQLRKAKRGAMTAAAAKGLLRRAEQYGLSVNDALQTYIDRNWITIDAEWLARSHGSPPALPPGARIAAGRRPTVTDAARNFINDIRSMSSEHEFGADRGSAGPAVLSLPAKRS